MRRGVVMDVDAVVSAGRCNISRCFAVALLAVVCVGMRTVSAEECLHCEIDANKPIPYSDLRCAPREITPKTSATPFPAFEGGPRCDSRRRRHARQHVPSATQQQTPSRAAPVARQV